MTKKATDCPYCGNEAVLNSFGIPICELGVSKLYLFREQTHMGRCIVAYKDHVSEIVELSEEERNAFFADVNRAAVAIHKAFYPDKLNYGAYGDTGGHLHFHIVPKYRDQEEWGSTFAMNPKQKYLSDKEYNQLTEMIRDGL